VRSELNVADGADVTEDNTCDTPGLLTTGTQTIAGAKTFSSFASFGVSGDYAAEFTSDVKIIESGSNPRLLIGDDTGGSGYGEINWNSSANSIQLGTATAGANTLILDQSDNATFSGTVTGTTFIGALTGNVTGNVTGNAGTVNISSDFSGTYPVLVDVGSGSVYNNPALTYNGTSDTLTSPNFAGALTGNASGSSATCSGLAGSATVLATARNIAGNSFNGSAAITIDIEDLDNVTVDDAAAGGSPSTGDIWIEY
jgi:hypothetical protein